MKQRHKAMNAYKVALPRTVLLDGENRGLVRTVEHSRP
jgi:hypothetical protein